MKEIIKEKSNLYNFFSIICSMQNPIIPKMSKKLIKCHGIIGEEGKII